jgi:hypothetical protein
MSTWKKLLDRRKSPVFERIATRLQRRKSTSDINSREEQSLEKPKSKDVKELFSCVGPWSDDGDDLVRVVPPVKFASCRVDIAGRTVSTYPMSRLQSVREGSPVCDSYGAHVYDSGIMVVCVTDGCGWGNGSRDAAVVARKAFTRYLEQNLSSLLVHVSTELCCAVQRAHDKVLKHGKSDCSSAGTTTLLGGVFVPVSKLHGDEMFDFHFVSVGDCRVFCRRGASKLFEDLTRGSRSFSKNASDPGGRIGPFTDDGEPDLRNMKTGHCVCRLDDIFLLMSDGVADNFDPERHGLMPKDCSSQLLCWSDLPDACFLKSDWTCVRMAGLLDKHIVSSSDVVQLCLDFCENTTRASRSFLENSTGVRLPHDYANYPGKMDHSTCLCISICRKDDA